MITIRASGDRGGADHGWLRTRHTFSFADYHDPAHMGFRVLRVMNEDRVAPAQGFGMHPHRDMEIFTWVLAGALSHRDSLGHGATIGPGEVQRITAGTGIAHSEFNASASDPVHFYQVWILPDRKGHEPGYEQVAFPADGRRGTWQTIISGDGADGSARIRQDARVRVTDLERQDAPVWALPPGRHLWVQVLSGSARVAGHSVAAGDGVAISGEAEVRISTGTTASVMGIELP
jgi:redox-sensitive bicupin YhaK (pirin superfamily)